MATEQQVRQKERFLESRRQKQRRKSLDKIRILASSGALLAALVGSLGLFVKLRSDAFRRDNLVVLTDYHRQRQEDADIASLNTKFDEMNRITTELSRNLASGAIKGLPSQSLSVADREALAKAERRDDDLAQRLSSLEGALLQTPEKAIAVPLLKQQLTDIEEKNKGDAENLHGEINRLYGMMQWFLGLMITLIVGVGGLAVNSFRQSSDKNKGGDSHKHHDPETATPSTTEKTPQRHDDT